MNADTIGTASAYATQPSSMRMSRLPMSINTTEERYVERFQAQDIVLEHGDGRNRKVEGAVADGDESKDDQLWHIMEY